jgi:hypothetical protein
MRDCALLEFSKRESHSTCYNTIYYCAAICRRQLVTFCHNLQAQSWFLLLLLLLGPHLGHQVSSHLNVLCCHTEQPRHHRLQPQRLPAATTHKNLICVYRKSCTPCSNSVAQTTSPGHSMHISKAQSAEHFTEKRCTQLAGFWVWPVLAQGCEAQAWP